MSVFYVDKGPTVRKQIGGYTISNTGGVDKVDDPSKLKNPGVGNYETAHAYKKSTFAKQAPSYSIPQSGGYEIEIQLCKANDKIQAANQATQRFQGNRDLP